MAVVDLGPYEIDNLYCGECADMMSRLPDGCIDLTVTSPPYDLVDEDMVTHPGKGLRDYQGYDWDFTSVAEQLWRVTKKGGVVVWVVGDATVNGSETGSSFRQALYFKDVGFRLADTMIYEVAGTGAKGSNKTYWQGFEFMFVLSKGNLGTSNRIIDHKNIYAKTFTGSSPKMAKIGSRAEPKNGKRLVPDFSARTNVWRIHPSNSNDVNEHQAPFPEALARDHIISWSNFGDLILDPFVGSGTTPKMAIEQARRFLGFDISQEYIDLARRRIQSARIPLPRMY